MTVSDKLARMLMLMVARIALKPGFRLYSFIEDSEVGRAVSTHQVQ